VLPRIMTTRRNVLALGAGFAFGGAAPPDTGRAALVIGNGAYPGGLLRQARTGAEAIARLLAKLNFRVYLAHNVTIRRAHIAVSDFVQNLRRDDLVVVYYCGEAVQVNGRNYLVPINSEALTPRALALEAIDLLDMVRQCEPEQRSGVIVLLDACRINAYQRRLHAYNNGLAPVTATPGTLYGFAAEPGYTGFDGEDDTTPYTAALLRVLGARGLTIEATLHQVRDQVFRATVEQQTPWFQSALTKPVILTA
jgi:uncharacterized caspase-like protein